MLTLVDYHLYLVPLATGSMFNIREDTNLTLSIKDGSTITQG